MNKNRFGNVWSDDFHFRADAISKLIDTCPDLIVKAKLYKSLGYVLKKHSGNKNVLNAFGSVVSKRIKKVKGIMGIVGGDETYYDKGMESAELARLTDEYLARGGKIEYIPYVTPDAATVKQLGFMRKFERENEYGI